MLLSAAVYDPNSPSSASTAPSPSTAGLFTPGLFTSLQPTDYFNSKPRAPRPASRNRADRVLARSPLGSPAILGPGEPDARHVAGAGAARAPSATRAPAAAPAADPVRTRAPSAHSAHGRSASRDHARSESRDAYSRSESRGHYRTASRDHARSESTSSRLDDPHHGALPRARERREKDKKTMLSRALQKANTAVLLDNAQNFEGAMEAYEDACKLLQQVMIRSSQDEDRRKLDAIRVTYTNRIEELRRLDPAYIHTTGKSLPARPMSGESLDEQRSMLLEADDDDDDDDDDDADAAVIETAAMARIVNDRSADQLPLKSSNLDSDPPPSSSHHLPLRKPQVAGQRESVISTAIRDVQRNMQTSQFHLQPPPGRLAGATIPLETPMDRSYMPPPLSPKRSKSPLFSATLPKEPFDSQRLLQPQQPTQSRHQRVHSNESTSWLDTIDESGGSSCSSSVRSLSPRSGARRKHARNTSRGTEAEFDAALDAAVEAAYDDGFEPFDDEDIAPDELMTTRMRNVELAKERVREAEREEAILAAKYRFKETQMQNETLPHVRESAELMLTDEAEEEERLLDEMTREYMLDGFDFDLQTKSSLPRQSDSSGFSAYNSSVSSHRTTGGTSLSTVAEVMQPPDSKSLPLHSPPPVPAPSGALPALPPPPPSAALPSVPELQPAQPVDPETTPRPTTATATKEAASVRSRRLSGQNAKTLKIETSLPTVAAPPHTEKPPVPAKNSPLDAPPVPKSAAAALFSGTQSSLDPTFKTPALPQVPQQTGLVAPSPLPGLPSPADTTATISPATPALSHALSNESGLAPGSPKSKPSTLGIRKNKSSLSLKQRTLSISSPDGSDASIGTPLSTTFSLTGRKPSVANIAPLPTPSLPTFNVDGLPSGGMHLFESDIHSPFSPGSPSPAVANAPIPLEPCPDTYLLRPFWLMRCFYQTIVHPRGGYLSTKLFIPRDVWRVKGVKIKNVEDKIANCDLLTAALQKMASMDTLDADMVLEEMQAFEVVLDQVQAQLSKKLGNDVGVQSVSSLFKDATSAGEGGAGGDSIRSMYSSQDNSTSRAVAQGKSYLTSWRKLRSKNSGVNLASLGGPKLTNGDVPKDSLNMATLPMTSLPSIRFAKRDTSGLTFEGPNSGYMSSLAKLFDSAQILDQIARQVEDPGLKHSSPTHVGLELSSRHAAEFFGFFVCRFVLADVTLLLDKFIKRGSEWVLV
ncbi:MIT domain-containing protein [Stagonosporopsis vannaccii]|nr:MIT domain-containing protein [Stagonosporopsis vannaccii]